MASFFQGVLDFLDQSDENETAYMRVLQQAQKRLEKEQAVAQDPTKPAQERMRALSAIQGLQTQIEGNPISKRESAKKAYEVNINRQLEQAGLTVKPPEAATSPINFGAVSSVQMPGSQTAPQQQTAADIVKGMFPGITITSTDRTEADQERLRQQGYDPAQNSFHKQKGMAVDFVLPKGVDPNATVAALEKAGFWAYHDPKRGHIHADRRQSPIATATPTITPQTALTSGLPVSYIDPQAIVGMIPNPRMIAPVDLPNAPQRELPAAIAPYEQANREAILAQLASVIQPKELDTKNDNWDRIAAALQGAAEAASGADPFGGLGQFLLRAGGGALAGQRAERKSQDAKKEKYDEAARQAQIALAKMGIDIDLSNLDVRNQNLDRTWKSDENIKDVKFGNANAIFESALKEAVTNLGITQQNIGTLNTRDLVRAQAGIDATENAAEAQNKSNATVAARAAQGAADQQERSIEQGLVKYGFDVANKKAPFYNTARGTMAAVLAKDVNGALQNLATELVANGAAAQILAPDKGDSPEAAEAKRKALASLKRAKKLEDASEAIQILTQLMQSDQAVALAIANQYQSTSPSARIILGENKAKVQ